MHDFTPISRRYAWVVMLRSLIFAVPLLIGAIGLERHLVDDGVIDAGTLLIPLCILLTLWVALRPFRIYARIGYIMAADHIRVTRGNLWRVDTIMPFSRVQHIDIDEGPLERLFGLAALIMHSAGTHNNTVRLPGLPRSEAEAMRDQIRAQIRQDSA